MNLFLIGYRGSGKTVLSKELSARSGIPFLDTDSMVVEKARKSIPDIFHEVGEPGFRKLENEILYSIPETGCRIVSTGGGIIENSENRAFIRRIGRAVYLKADAEILLKRIYGDINRPNLTGLNPLDEIKVVLERRKSWYEETAHFTIDTGIFDFEEELMVLGIVLKIVRDYK